MYVWRERGKHVYTLDERMVCVLDNSTHVKIKGWRHSHFRSPRQLLTMRCSQLLDKVPTITDHCYVAWTINYLITLPNT